MVDVSIIVPIYNRARILLSCLDSISCIKQKKYEVILIDDGSTDDTPLICEEYCKNHTDFYYYRKENGGVSSARNLGIEKSNGKLITFVDSDDVVTPEHLDFLNCKETINYDIIILGMRNLSSVDHGGVKVLLMLLNIILQNLTKNILIGSRYVENFIGETSVKNIKLDLEKI